VVDHHINGEINIGGADAGGIEGQAADLQRHAQRIGIFERTIQHRLAVAAFADDMVGRALADFHPIALGIGQIQLVGRIAGQLAADQRVHVEVQARLREKGFVLGGHPAQFRGKAVDRLVQLVAGRLGLVQRLVEIGKRLVAHGAQPRGHDEEGAVAVLVGGNLAGAGHFIARGDARVGDADQALFHRDAQAKRHGGACLIVERPRQWPERCRKRWRKPPRPPGSYGFATCR